MEPLRGSLFPTSLPRRGAHAPRRGFTHVWPPANHTKDTPTPYTSPLPTSTGGTHGMFGRRPYMCITPTWTSAFLRESSLGTTHPYRPIPRRGYICETTMDRIYCCNQTLNPVTCPHPQAARPERLAGGHTRA